MLLLLVIPLLGITAALADFIHYRHLCCRTGRRYPLRAVWYVATDALMLLIPLVGLFLRDNSTGYMFVVMWALWGWMVTVLPRLAGYLFRRLGLRRTGYVVAAAGVVLLVWGAFVGRTSLRVEEVEICSENLPQGFDGARFVQLSDLHIGTMASPERMLRRLVDTVNALRPEWIVLTGDLVNIRSTELDARMAALLQRFEAPVYSVTGNHDVGAYIKDTVSTPREVSLLDLIARQRAMGWTLLDNESRMLCRNGDSITLSGISFAPELRHHQHRQGLSTAGLDAAYASIPDSLYNITLVHLPQLWEQIRATEYGDLTLSGHVHAMQLKVPCGERGWSPAAWLYDRWSGLYQVDDRALYINDGIGSVGYPMRIGADPEITLFTLKSCK